MREEYSFLSDYYDQVTRQYSFSSSRRLDGRSSLDPTKFRQTDGNQSGGKDLFYNYIWLFYRTLREVIRHLAGDEKARRSTIEQIEKGEQGEFADILNEN